MFIKMKEKFQKEKTKICENNNMIFFETSDKTGDGVKDLLQKK